MFKNNYESHYGALSNPRYIGKVVGIDLEWFDMPTDFETDFNVTSSDVGKNVIDIMNRIISAYNNARNASKQFLNVKWAPTGTNNQYQAICGSNLNQGKVYGTFSTTFNDDGGKVRVYKGKVNGFKVLTGASNYPTLFDEVVFSGVKNYVIGMNRAYKCTIFYDPITKLIKYIESGSATHNLPCIHLSYWVHYPSCPKLSLGETSEYYTVQFENVVSDVTTSSWLFKARTGASSWYAPGESSNVALGFINDAQWDRVKIPSFSAYDDLDFDIGLIISSYEHIDPVEVYSKI